MKEFDKYAKRGAYHFFWYANNIDSYRDQIDFVVACFPDPGRILDAGCGDGVASLKLFEAGHRVVGIDNSKLAIKFAREHTIKQRKRSSALKFEVGSIYDIGLLRKFNYALCHGVLEHLLEPKKALQRVWDAINFYMVIMVPNVAAYKKDKYDYCAWSKKTIGALVADFDPNFEILAEGKLLYVKLSKVRECI